MKRKVVMLSMLFLAAVALVAATVRPLDQGGRVYATLMKEGRNPVPVVEMTGTSALVHVVPGCPIVRVDEDTYRVFCLPEKPGK